MGRGWCEKRPGPPDSTSHHYRFKTTDMSRMYTNAMVSGKLRAVLLITTVIKSCPTTVLMGQPMDDECYQQVMTVTLCWQVPHYRNWTNRIFSLDLMKTCGRSKKRWSADCNNHMPATDHYTHCWDIKSNNHQMMARRCFTRPLITL